MFYDLRNPEELKKYMDKKQREFKRVNDNTLSIQEKYIEFIKERQNEIKEQLNKKQIEKDINEQIEKELPKALDKALNNIFKGKI